MDKKELLRIIREAGFKKYVHKGETMYFAPNDVEFNIKVNDKRNRDVAGLEIDGREFKWWKFYSTDTMYRKTKMFSKAIDEINILKLDIPQKYLEHAQNSRKKDLSISNKNYKTLITQLTEYGWKKVRTERDEDEPKIFYAGPPVIITWKILHEGFKNGGYENYMITEELYVEFSSRSGYVVNRFSSGRYKISMGEDMIFLQYPDIANIKVKPYKR